jgi:translation initiation factor 4E
MIGENFHEYNDQICGAVISVRPQKDRIALWTTTASDEAAVMSIGRTWKSLLNLGDGFRLTYQAHKESMKTNKNRGGSLYEC